MSIQDARTSERYQPRWELWVPVFIHYSYTNVINSLSSFQVATHSMQGMMVSETRVAWDKLVGNVLLLEAQIMDFWREKNMKEKDDLFASARTKFHEFLRKENPSPLEAMEQAAEFFHEIIQLLSRRGNLRFKPPRSFGRKHDD